MKKIFAIISIIVLSATLSVILIYPAIPHFTTQLIGDGGDNYEYASYMGLAAKQIHDNVLPLSHTNFWRYPVGIDFFRSFDSFITIIIGTILTLIFNLPLSYNITILFLMTLNGIFSFIFFRKITKSYILGIIGMVLYGFSFYTLARANAHPNLLFIGGFPLAYYFLIRLYERHSPTLKDFLWFFLAIVFISLGSSQYLVLFGIFTCIICAVYFLFYKHETLTFIKRVIIHKKTALQAAGIALTVFLIFFLPQIIALLSGDLQLASRDDTLYTATPGIDNFFLPNTYLNLAISPIASASSRESIESMVFLGWVEILSFMLFCLRNNISKRFRFLITTLFIIPLVLAMGYGKEDSFPLLPYHFLSQIFIFKIIAETNRYIVVAYLIFVAAIVIGLKHIKSKYLSICLIVTLLIAALFERFPLSFRTVPTLMDDAYVHVVNNTSASAVLDLPIDIYTPKYNMTSLGYNKPIVTGYFHWLSDGTKEKSFLQDNNLFLRYTCSTNDPILQIPFNFEYEDQQDAQLLQTLKQNGITTLVVHKDSNYLFSNCQNVRIRLNHFIPFEQPLEPSTKQVEYTHSLETGQPSFTFFFPYDGTFYLDGAYISTRGNGEFSILQDYQPATFDYSWNINQQQHYMTLNPQNTIKFTVKGGDHLTIHSSDIIDYTYLAFYYRYVPDPNAQKVDFNPEIKRVYEDNKTIVYTINTK